MRLHHDFCMIDDVPQGTIEEKMVSVLEYGRIYPKLVSLKEKQIQSAYLKQFKDVQAQKEKLKTQYEFDVEQHKANNEFTKDVEDLLKGTYKKDIEDLEAQLPEKYQRSNLTKGVITGIDIFVNTITTTGINFVAGRLSRGTINDVNVSLPSRTKEWLNKQAISWNARNARDNNDLPNTTVPQRPSYVPSAERPSEEYQQEAINKIESPFKRMLNITQEFTLESLETVTPQTLEALFETTFFMAKNQDLDIHERFKPFVKLIETMPRDNFRENGFMNEERLLKVTSLIKDALDLKRGDFASALIRPFITKLKEQNNQLLNGEGDISEKLREEFSEITENSVVLSNKPFDLNTVDKRNPLDTMWELMKTFHITEAEDDPEELKDIPLSGHLPEIVDNALNDLRKFELKATKRLIDLALLNNQVVTEDNSGQQHILKRNEAFNGRDKKFLSLLIAKSMRVINPNPLNDMIAKFLCLYEGGHFAEGGGFSDSVQDDHTVNLNVLERLVDLVQRGRTKDGEPTILQRLDQEPARHNEDYQENGRTRSRIKQGKCDFKDVYDECNGNLDAMRTRFNRFTPKPFTVRITPEMSKQREAKKATYASLGGNGNTPNPTSSLGGI